MLHFTALHQVAQADLAEKTVYLIAEVAPQMVGQAHFALLAIAGATTAGGIYRLIHRIYNLGDKYLVPPRLSR